MLSFIMCDDDLNMLNRMSSLFENCFIKHDYDAKIIFKTTKYQELLDYISHNKFDVVLLDILLDNESIDGLDIAKQIRHFNKECYIIFTTGHMEYLWNAFKCKTFDYLYKPLSEADVENTLERLFDDINGLPKRYLKIDNRNIVVDVNDVQYISREGMKLIYHTSSNEFETYSSFNKIENSLPDNFVRCHKSFIANLDNVTDIQLSSNTISFKDHSSCDIGPKYKNNLLEVFNNYGSFE